MKRYELTSVKKTVFTAICVALCVMLPIAFHAFPNGGSVFSPMHIPALLCGLICGARYGLLCGLLGPLLSSLLTGMPGPAYMPQMMIELAAYGFIAGLLKHVRSMAAVTNPLVNSYKRLVPGYEAPCYLAWSASNRSALIRIPAARGSSTRLELRCPDPACNPYLALALCLVSGLDGIENGLVPPAEITENIFSMDETERLAHGIKSLPGNLYEAVGLLCEDALLADPLGPQVFRQYTEGKKREWDEYRTRVTDWELEKYMIVY